MRRVTTAVVCALSIGFTGIAWSRPPARLSSAAPPPPDFVAGCTLPFADIAGHHSIDHACTIAGDLGARPRRCDTGDVQIMTGTRRDRRTRQGRKRSNRSEEDRSIGHRRPSGLQVVHEGVTDGGRHRIDRRVPILSSRHVHLRTRPVDVLEAQRRDLSGAEPVGSQ
jgi:hypothetical protein